MDPPNWLMFEMIERYANLKLILMINLGKSRLVVVCKRLERLGLAEQCAQMVSKRVWCANGVKENTKECSNTGTRHISGRKPLKVTTNLALISC